MMFLLIVIFVAIVLLIIWGIRHKETQRPIAPYPVNTTPFSSPMPPRGDSACDLARMRYAKGEISKEEFEDICSTLKGMDRP